MIDLWAEDIGLIAVKTPVAILKEQASLLGRKTKNLLVGEITAWSPSPCQFGYRFNISAPAINYKYSLFAIYYDINMYPMGMILDESVADELRLNERYKDLVADQNKVTQIASEEMLIEILGIILKSHRTKQVVNSLLAQSIEYTQIEEDAEA